MIWALESKQSSECWKLENEAKAKGEKFECKCKLPEKLTKEELIKELGLK